MDAWYGLCTINGEFVYKSVVFLHKCCAQCAGKDGAQEKSESEETNELLAMLLIKLTD